MTTSESPQSPRSTSRIQSFGYAFQGLYYVIRTQENAWIHAVMSVAVVIVGIFLKISFVEFAILALAMMGVWVSETINTALEAVVDLASPEIHPLAKVGKDTAAGAVLIAAMFATVIGLLILGPPLVAFLLPLLQLN